jgi:hypothetical protein
LDGDDDVGASSQRQQIEPPQGRRTVEDDGIVGQRVIFKMVCQHIGASRVAHQIVSRLEERLLEALADIDFQPKGTPTGDEAKVFK